MLSWTDHWSDPAGMFLHVLRGYWARLQIRSKSNYGGHRLFRGGGNAAIPVIQAGQPRESPDTEILHEVLFSYQFYDVRLM